MGGVSSCPGTSGGVPVQLLLSLSGGATIGSLPLVITIVIPFGRHRVVMELIKQ